MLGCRYVAGRSGLFDLFPAGRLGCGFASCSAGRSDLGLLVPSRPVRSGVALCQAGLAGRSVAAQCRRWVELAVGGGAVITRESVVGRCGCQVPGVPRALEVLSRSKCRAGFCSWSRP